METIFNAEFWCHLAILGALMIGFTAFKIANCKPFNPEGEDFSPKLLGLGLARNVIVILGVCVVFIVSALCGSELLLVQIGKTQVTLQSAIDITTLVILGVYGAKYIKNLAEYSGVADKMTEVKEVLPKEVTIKDMQENCSCYPDMNDLG